MVRKSRKKRKIRVLKRIAFWGIIVFISCTGMYFYRKYKDIQLQNIVSHTTENEGIEGRLQKMSNYDLRIKDIVENKSQYPEELLELLTTNIETIEFVLNYPEKKNNSPAETVEETRSGEIPLLLQWDERWGYQNYGDSMFAVNGCGPTALSMVIVGLTENKQATPYQVAQYAEKNGYYVEGVQKLEPVMSGDTYRSENTIFTDMNFPEKPSGEEGNPLFRYAIFKVANVDQYDAVKKEIEKVDIDWKRYDLIDSNGNIQSMAENFNNMKQLSEMLLIVVSAASFIILSLIFLFWMKNRTQEIGIFMALGESKKKIWSQFLWEALLIGILGLLLSFMISPALSKMTASYMAQQSQSQAEEQKEATQNQVFADGYIAPDLKFQTIEIEITSDMLVKDTIAIGGLLFVSVSVAGTMIMRKKPKEILSEMS